MRELERVEGDNQELRVENEAIGTRMHALEAEVGVLRNKVVSFDSHHLELASQRHRESHDGVGSGPIQVPETRTQFTAFACTGNDVTLLCPEGRTIQSTSAYYAQYSQCSDCCVPNPAIDCTQLMSQSHPQD